MSEILFLTHRLPYPPNKGDKVHTYHLLKYLAGRHRVRLGTFVDDPADLAYVDIVRGMCDDLHVSRLTPSLAKLGSLSGLLSGEPLTLPYYRSAGLRQWIRASHRARPFDAAVIYSSSMAQYADELRGCDVLLVYDDVDSAKWSEYANRHPWPMSWVYRREGRHLLAFERASAAAAKQTFFVTAKEVEFFLGLAPECAGKVDHVPNGVDAEFFDPAISLERPFGEAPVIAFTGAMDYWPNVDAVSWFVAEALPQLRRTHPDLHFWIVGRSPTPAVQALACDHVHVTGTVDDVRPYLRHAAAVVAPLRLARGLQNKILEAMAMARPVVAARSCVAAIEATPDTDIVAAEEAAEYVQGVSALLADRERAEAMGARARTTVLERYSWAAHLARLDAYLPAPRLHGASAS